MAGRKRWPRERIVAVLKDQDEAPTARDLQVPGDDTLPAYQTVLREFGSLEAALKEAGHNGGLGKRGRRKVTT